MKKSLSIFMMLLIYMGGRGAQGVCVKDERTALLEIKASLHEYFPDVDNLLSSWVDHGRTSGECCEWERIKCDKVTGHVTDLSLSNLLSEDYESFYDRTWPLDFSLFIHFKDLRNLDVSWNYIDDTFVGKGVKRLSSLKKLETLNLSNNRIETNIFPSLASLVSLKILDLSKMKGYESYDPSSTAHDIFEFSTLKNLEVLDLTGCGCYGTLQMQGSEKFSILKKLKILILGDNQFNEKPSFIFKCSPVTPKSRSFSQ
ncbi:putative non-specific serine/threonine protein kinase [Helianthus debilis subsp. tardiflorus]